MLDRVQLHTVMTHDAPIDLHTVKTIWLISVDLDERMT